jgi:hypothetical protein
MSETESQKLTLEEYKYEVFVYKKYKEKLHDLKEELTRLEKEESEYRRCPPLLYWSLCVSFTWIFVVNEKNFLGGLFLSLLLAGLACGYIGILLPDYISNLLNLGRLNKVKRLSEENRKHIERIEGLKEEIYKKIELFEKTICDNYQIQLAEFFDQNLYKKRSGGQKFEEALAEFSSTIEEISPINSALVTNHIFLDEYKEYLKKRTINHNFQASKKSEGLTSVRSFVKSISEPQKQKEIISPEKLYWTARKIDNWDEINQKRRINGKKGEDIVMALEKDFLESIGRKDLSDKIRHVSVEDGDGLGYDILSFFGDGKEKYIEVKSTTSSIETPYLISRNELSFLREHLDDSFVCRVVVSDEGPRYEMRSARIVVASELIPTQYLVSAK